MKYLVMIHDVNDVQCRGDFTSYLWYGRINAQFFHNLRKRMAAVFEERCREYPFSDGCDLAATVLNAYGEQEPVYCTYGGFIAYDVWEMYTGSIVHGTYKLARWQRALSPSEMNNHDEDYIRDILRQRGGDPD